MVVLELVEGIEIFRVYIISNLQDIYLFNLCRV